MPSPLSKRLQETLKFISQYSEQQGVPPTIKEIADNQDIAPPSAHAQIQRLEESGFIERTPNQWRSIRVINSAPYSDVLVKKMVQIPVVGQVAAGQPIFAEGNVESQLAIDPSFAQRGGVLFALKIKGDSMVGADILDGDYVIVRQQPVADNGDIVVALIGDEGTVKRLKMEGDKIELVSENPKRKPIKVTHGDEFRIVGKALAVYRMTRLASHRN